MVVGCIKHISNIHIKNTMRKIRSMLYASSTQEVAHVQFPAIATKRTQI
jgi:hypothetical protein